MQAVKSDPQHLRFIPVPLRQAGVYINEDTALRFSAVFRAISFIAQAIAILPWDVLLESPNKTTKLTNHQARRILGVRPNREMSAIAFRETLVAWALSWGNGYAEIELDQTGSPIALWPISPNRVQVKRDPDTGQIVYHVENYMGGTTQIAPEKIFHLHGLGFDGLVGYSVISLASRSVALGIAAEDYGADFFANGAVSTGALKHPGTLGPKARENIRESFREVMAGHGNRFNLPIFEEGMDWVNMMINAEDAQILATRQFQVTDIARWFGIPPHKLADLTHGTFSNIEHQTIEVVNDALMPWIHRLEQEANYKLIRPSEKGVRTRLNVLGLLRGDGKSRADYYQIMRNIGIYSTNDIRRLEDMDPVGPEGDELLVQLSFTTLKRLAAGDVKQPPQPAEPKILQHSFGILFRAAYERILKREIGQFERDRTSKDSFDAWFDNYFVREKSRVEQDVEPLAMSFLISIAPQAALNGNVSEAVKIFSEWHLGSARTAFSVILAGGSEDFCSQERIIEGARFLAECLAGLSLRSDGSQQIAPGDSPLRLLSSVHRLADRLGKIEQILPVNGQKGREEGFLSLLESLAAMNGSMVERISEATGMQKEFISSIQEEIRRPSESAADLMAQLIEIVGDLRKDQAEDLRKILEGMPREIKVSSQPIPVSIDLSVRSPDQPRSRRVDLKRDEDGRLIGAEISEGNDP